MGRSFEVQHMKTLVIYTVLWKAYQILLDLSLILLKYSLGPAQYSTSVTSLFD